jgi:hypothetical protein
VSPRDVPAPAIEIVSTGSRHVDAAILRVWRDGRVVWSADPISGGPPYRVGAGDPAKIAGALAVLSAEGRWTKDYRTGPCARWTRILVRGDDGPIIDVGSWHEVVEQDPRLFAGAGSMQSLEGRPRAEVLAEQPAEYLAFRARWDRVKRALLAVTPPSGEPLDAAEV